ncbi:hypothetical protein [Empedobacter sedimenti]|uniref:hypothetical protein n=1 Tax=Empedobacter sedimenti TaxID=3042610 RepID=UPI0024A651BD|nr:hypothetical protein [Empedobacter sedimenti]
MLLNIIFSYNRAMQLDFLLRSIISRFKIDNYSIAVIYHTTGNHNIGYDLLKKKYKEYNFIKFYERSEGYDLGILPALNCRSHFKFFNKYHFKNKKRDNFKGLLENLLKSASHEFVMFDTDDGYFNSDFTISNDVLNLIRNNKTQVSYRNYVGENIEGYPDYVKDWGEFKLWDYYYDNTKITHWSYPFSVDGTIYHTKGLLSIISRVAYHNPITFEDRVFHFVKRNKLLGIGLSPKKSILNGTVLNRVSVDTNNAALNIDINFLNEKFIEGYELELVFPERSNHVNIVPLIVSIKKDNSSKVIYEIDEYGQSIQNKFGPEGSKN